MLRYSLPYIIEKAFHTGTSVVIYRKYACVHFVND